MLLLLEGTQALYDAASACGYQRRDGKVAAEPGKRVAGGVGPELRAINHDHEHKLICYNWPRLSEHVLRKWRTEPRTRHMMHSAVLEFLYRDFKLKDTATEWAEDGVFIQAVDHAQKSTDEASAGEYLQFERLHEKLQLVLLIKMSLCLPFYLEK